MTGSDTPNRKVVKKAIKGQYYERRQIISDDNVVSSAKIKIQRTLVRIQPPGMKLTATDNIHQDGSWRYVVSQVNDIAILFI